MTSPTSISVTAEYTGLRVDLFLARHFPEHSRAALQKLIAAEHVFVNGTPARSRTRLQSNDCITIQMWPETSRNELTPEKIDFTIVYEDTDILVIDKPVGLAVHPGAGQPTTTLVNGLLDRYPELFTAMVDDAQRPGIVHRLDRDTSGALIVAKTPNAHTRLTAQFAERRVKKTYLAIVHGCPIPERGTVDAAIGRHRYHRHRMAVVKTGGKHAVTHFSTLASATGYAVLVVELETGRTHQIRVHMAHLGHPLVGDTTYGRRRQESVASRQMLHAWRLEFDHPTTGHHRCITVPPPDDWIRTGIDCGFSDLNTMAYELGYD